ncbi:MAG TPA: serine hydrolase domain-containing protein [Longimicrobium sp.]|nr:serine hydrolase domain-containing protein [Longimicrobium sp.]
MRLPNLPAPFRAGWTFAAAGLAAMLWSCAPSPHHAGKDGDVAARVDSLVATYQRRNYVPGMSVAVIRNGRDTLAYRGYGLADVENGVPATPETVYPIASNTKQFTAAAVMRLVDEKRLALDDPVGRYLPKLPAAWRRIPVRQFLNHTSGIPDSPILLPYEVAPDSVLERAGTKPLDFAPGTRWKYSNTGYLVLGRLIEAVSGEPYAQYLETKILAPNGLTETRPCDADALIRHRAAGYELDDTTVVNAAYVHVGTSFSAGGLCSTAGGLARWNRALATGRVVSPAAWARMTTPEGAATGYGYGLIVMSLDGHRLVGHGGEIAGFRSSSAYLPSDSLSATVLTNLGSEDPGPLTLGIARAVLGASRPPASPGGGRR